MSTTSAYCPAGRVVPNATRTPSSQSAESTATTPPDGPSSTPPVASVVRSAPSTVTGWSATTYAAPFTATSSLARHVTSLSSAKRSGAASMVSVPVCCWPATKLSNAAASMVTLASACGATARSALSRPPETDRPEYSPDGSTVAISRSRTCAGVREGSRDSTSADAAATCGVAIDVPCIAAYPLWSTVEAM